MFTRMAKGVLTFFEVVVVLAAIGLGLTFGIGLENGTVGFLIFLLTLVVGILLIFFFGLFVELCNNVMDIRETLKTGKPVDQSATRQTSGPTSKAQHFSNPEFDLSKIAAEYEKERETKKDIEVWYCRFCGTANEDMSAQVCGNCGKSRS